MSSRPLARSAIAEADGGLPPALTLARAFWPAPARPLFDALAALDARFDRIVRTASQPVVGAIRLAWWRDALAALDGAPPPPEPLLADLAALLPGQGTALSAVAAGHMARLDEIPDAPRIAVGGAALFAAAAPMLGADPSEAAALGKVHALRQAGLSASAPPRVGGAARPLGLWLTAAALDEAPPRRLATALLRHRWTGRLRIG